MQAGAVQALCLQLGYILNKLSSEEELELLCRALDILHHCSRSVRESSLREIGSDLFVLLRRAIAQGQRRSTAREIISIWHTCSGSALGAHMLLKCDALLSTIVGVLLDENDVATETKLEALGLVKNLSYYAEDHRSVLLEHPGMLTCLSRLPFSRLCENAMERLSAVFRNLAVAPNTRKIMTQQHDLLNALIRLSSSANRRTTRNTLSTILSLTMEADSCTLLVMHGEGILLSVLARFVLKEDDQVVRRRAARALRFLARDKGARLIMCDALLMDTLSQSALHDNSHEVRFEASEAFACCAANIQAPMPHHNAVLHALMKLATDGDFVVADAVARALKEQARHPINRVCMANHDGLLSALSKKALCEVSSIIAKENATCALRDLCTNLPLWNCITTKTVLAALVKNAMEQSDESRTVREYAVGALVNLASLASNRKRMVTYTGLLNALLHFAATSSDSAAKSAVKKVILVLVADL